MSAQKQLRILMIVENCAFLRDPRVRKEAKNLHSAGHQVAAICPKAFPSQPWRESINGITIYRYLPMPAGLRAFGYSLEYAYATLAIALLSLIVLLREGFDVIHVANPPDTLVLTVASYKLIGKRVIYDQHDLCPELLTTKFRKLRWILPLLLWLERWSYRLADHVIVTNESYRANALVRGQIAASKITVVRNGSELRNIGSGEVDWELRSRSNNIIVYAGTIGSQDGLDCLCRILHSLRYELARPDFHCVVLGDGDALSEVQTLVRELHLEDNVCFAGWIDDPSRYLTFLHTADICVSPDPSTSYNNQSTFIKIMDYMAAGKPIVAFELPETRYSARDSALYSPVNDERQFALRLAELMDNPALRKQLGDRGKKRVREELAWEYSVPHLLRAYRACWLGTARTSKDLRRNVGGKKVQSKHVPHEVVRTASASSRQHGGTPPQTHTDCLEDSA